MRELSNSNIELKKLRPLSKINDEGNKTGFGYEALQNDTDMSLSQALDSSVLPLTMGTKPNFMTDESIESGLSKPIRRVTDKSDTKKVSLANDVQAFSGYADVAFDLNKANESALNKENPDEFVRALIADDQEDQEQTPNLDRAIIKRSSKQVFKTS